MRPHQLLQTSSSFSKISKPIADLKKQDYSSVNITNAERFSKNITNNSKKPIYIISSPVSEAIDQVIWNTTEKETSNKTVQENFETEENISQKPIYIITMNET